MPSPDDMPRSLPVSVTPREFYGLSGEEPVLDERVDILAEVRQSAAAAHSRKVEQRHQQRGREALQTLSGAPLAVHGLQIGEASSTRQGTAPHQAVAQDGPLEELTAERTSHNDDGEQRTLGCDVTPVNNHHDKEAAAG